MGKEEDDVKPGHDAITSNQSMATFKAAVRWTAARGIAKEDDWHFSTSYARSNRLSPLGITNTHAALKCLPILDEDEAKAVAKEIMLAKGLLKTKKQKPAHENGMLQSFARPLLFHRKTAKSVCAKYVVKLAGKGLGGSPVHFGQRYEYA